MPLDDERYIQRCIELALQAEGRTSPNPLVGSVVVDDDGTIIAEGFHAKAGEPHAEVQALNIAGEAARGKTIYVSLEPCCHHGKTGPCSDRVIASGVKRVVCGMVDPNPKVAGGGLAAIQAAGIETRSGVLEADCRYLNRAFLKWIQHGTPWVVLKLAATLDGRIADRNGKSRWISGPEARRHVHKLRNTLDAVMVGRATVVADNAELTVREIDGSRNPIKVILDGALVVGPDARALQGPENNALIYCSEEAFAKRQGEFAKDTLIATPLHNGKLDLNWILQSLGSKKIQSVLCEGGSKLAASLLQNHLVDELHWIIAPKIIGDVEAIPAVSGLEFIDLNDAIRPLRHSYTPLGEDLLFQALLTSP